MNILIVGRGKGSWTMRGLQLGAALGARVTTLPTTADWQWAERIVLVKREGLRWIPSCRPAGVPVVWDAIDFWRQPAQNHLTELEARVLLRAWQDQIQPTVTIGATREMAEAAGGPYLPHHGHLGLVPTDAREVCHVVGYEGAPVYLDAWSVALQQACAARGWQFVINPPNLAAVDILVALRGGLWDGWMAREWKSGVKVVNAILAGRPLIYQHSAAVRDLNPIGTAVATCAQLPDALDAWTSHAARQHVVDVSRTRVPTLTVDAVATHYASLLTDLKGC